MQMQLYNRKLHVMCIFELLWGNLVKEVLRIVFKYTTSVTLQELKNTPILPPSLSLNSMHR